MALASLELILLPTLLLLGLQALPGYYFKETLYLMPRENECLLGLETTLTWAMVMLIYLYF